MKKTVFSKKTAKTAETAPPKKPAKAGGPVELSAADLKKVSGGLPKGGWTPVK